MLIPANMNGGKPEGGAPEDEGKQREIYHCILSRCFIPDGGAMTDKEPGECLPGELSIHEITPEDAGAIVAALGELNKEKQAPAEEAGPDAAFPAGQGPAGQDPTS
jgi:hypothetical protein